MKRSAPAFAAIVALVALSCGDGRGERACGASVYVGPSWVATGGALAFAGAGAYFGGWYDPGDTWDGSDVPGDDTSTPVGDDTAGDDGADTSGDPSGGDPSGGDTSGGDTSGGDPGGAAPEGVNVPVSSAAHAPDGYGCYECVVACTAQGQAREARGYSVHSYDRACAHAVGALERWAHATLGARLDGCENVDDVAHTPAAPSVGVSAAAHQLRAIPTPAEVGPLGAVK